MPSTLGLFVVTALAEIVGCYLPYLWLRRDGSPWLLVPAAAALAAFARLLSLHPLGGHLKSGQSRPVQIRPVERVLETVLV